jgi:hypothetical protein
MWGEGRIFRRGRLWWFAYSRNGREYRESSRSTDEDAAKRLLRKRLSVPNTDSSTIHDLAKRPHILDQLSYRDVKVLHAECYEALEHLQRRLTDLQPRADFVI